ncbi:CaiB/BaiF CoA transferase family protein [Pseudogemmobacter sonorensis]|uniref:CaiB/BaiF CoA transferase family protein n=1 Tax=Pseudogemmobacter sonorensis TaxID=2989681 RepID=UPI003675B161
MAPLEDILVLDFSTLLPGPLATLFLAEAGAKVIKIERPGQGDEMRSYLPALDGEGINFAMLNRGKRSIALDLKDPASRRVLMPLLQRADVVVEQFRPGVMARLGLGYEDIRKIRPDVVYCSISGWGSNGPKAHQAAHDLNFMAETGVLGLSVGADGAPILPPILAGDIAGGAYPAMINILLALRRRDRSGEGAWLDLAMGENLYPFLYWALGNAHALDLWPAPGAETVTGGSPRYQIYRTRDGRHIAAAPLEDKFWATFTALIGLPEAFVDDGRDPAASRVAVAARIAMQDAAHWQGVFAGKDVCCSLVLSLQEALADPHWAARGIFGQSIEIAGKSFPSLPSIIAPVLRGAGVAPRAPGLGADGARV